LLHQAIIIGMVDAQIIADDLHSPALALQFFTGVFQCG